MSSRWSGRARSALLWVVALAGCVRFSTPLADPDGAVDAPAPADRGLELSAEAALLDALVPDLGGADLAKPDLAKPDLAEPDLGIAGGSTLWAKQVGAAGDEIAESLAVDPSGNITVVGHFAGTVDFGGGGLTSAGGTDVFVASYSNLGVHRWSKRFGAAGDDNCRGVAVDGSGNLTIVGHFTGAADFGGGTLSASGQAIFVASYTSAGAHRWSKRFGGNSSSGQSVSAEAGGEIYVAGYFSGAQSFGGPTLTSAGDIDVFLASFTSAGAHRWSLRAGGNLDDAAWSVSVAAGVVAVAGYFQKTVDFGGGGLTSLGARDAFVASYTTAGTPGWSRRLGGSSGDDHTFGVVVDSGGGAIVTGEYGGTADFGGGPRVGAGGQDIFLASYGATGVHRWSLRFGGTGYDSGRALALDAAGTIFLPGVFNGSIELGGGPLVSAGESDVLVASFAVNGVHLWSRRFGGSLGDNIVGAVRGPSAVHLAGDFKGTVDFGGGAKTATGRDLYLLTLAP